MVQSLPLQLVNPGHWLLCRCGANLRLIYTSGFSGRFCIKLVFFRLELLFLIQKTHWPNGKSQIWLTCSELLKWIIWCHTNNVCTQCKSTPWIILIITYRGQLPKGKQNKNFEGKNECNSNGTAWFKNCKQLFSCINLSTQATPGPTLVLSKH